MRLVHRALLASYVFAAVAACARAVRIDAAAEERAIRALDEKWSPAVARNDVDAAVSLYTADATLLWPNAPAAKGTDAVRTAWTAVMKTPGLKLAVVPERVEVAAAGDVATDVGRVESEVTAPNGSIKAVSKYLHVWHKVGAEWRLYYSMTNSNSPPVPPPTPSPQQE